VSAAALALAPAAACAPTGRTAAAFSAALFVAAAVVAAVLAIAAPARAERLVSSLSSHQVMITSSFTGEELVLFGSVERDGATVPRHSDYEIVVTVTGPRQTLVTRRKDRVVGIWVNVESRVFVDVPSYLAVLATKPFDQITNEEAQHRLQIGLANTLLPQQIGVDLADVNRDDTLREAFLRLQERHKLYVEAPNGVTFLTPTLYRASIPLPAEAPIGSYDVDVKLFADGSLITRTNSAFEIVKVGFEQFVASAARDRGFVYGMATAMMALMTGWLASVVFRKD
jgi:uncharacterized protein (TIGR02186 family)